jgi:DNA-binding LacI/PurR family transcriptional regulator
MAAGVYRAAWELRIRIPEELSVVGFDDSSAARLVLPPLTSVHQPMEEMGAAATGAVVDRLSGQPAQGKVFNTALVIRQSTARPTEVYS